MRLRRFSLVRLLLLSLTAMAVLVVGGCGNGLEPITAPTLPASIPGFAELDPATGLHVTGTPEVIDPQTYRLKIDGKVEHPLELTYDDLRRMQKVTETVTLECPATFTDVATWSGVPLKDVLEEAGIQQEATEIRMNAIDGHYGYLPLERALNPENLLAYELGDDILPALHGFPIRVVLPGEIGTLWVKWLTEIVVQ